VRVDIEIDDHRRDSDFVSLSGKLVLVSASASASDILALSGTLNDADPLGGGGIGFRRRIE
jgi:hypothetical protein